MDEEPGALDVAQELVAQARPGVGALDQAGDVGDHEGMQRIDPHHAEVGRQSGERIIGDLGTRGREARD